MLDQLFEFDNQLYIIDIIGQIVIFDNYGIFVGFEKVDGDFVQLFENVLLVVNGNELYVQDFEIGEKLFFFLLDVGQKIE